jgi:phage shock protein PspC (stress-responsive transcriptional regulator)
MQAGLAKGGAMDPTRKLYRSKTNRKLAGVCGGLAQYFNIDATLIRVLFVLLAVLGGSGLVLYVAMWIIVPKGAVKRGGAVARSGPQAWNRPMPGTGRMLRAADTWRSGRARQARRAARVGYRWWPWPVAVTPATPSP